MLPTSSRVGLALILALLPACERSENPSATSAGATPSTRPSASVAPPEPKPTTQYGSCKASGDKPQELARVNGDVYGFDSDATRLYYSSWQLYGSRGDVILVRKDGEGTEGLTTLKYEPRSLAVDDQHLLFTAGIQLQRMPKDGSSVDPVNDQFSAKSIALYGGEVFGVPGDYGPYDRVAKIGKKGGELKELGMSTRPKTDPPNGFNRVVVDETGIYIADSGGKRVAQMPLKGGKPQTLAKAKGKVYDLVVTTDNVYFTVHKGPLLGVAKRGGKVTELAPDLVELPRLAGDEKALYTVLAGSGDAPNALARITPSDSTVKMLAPLTGTNTVTAIATDDRCVYWVERESSAKSLVFALPR